MQQQAILRRSETALIVIDVQERLSAVMQKREQLLERCARLIKGFQLLKLPVLATEQYPKGLGRTEAPLAELLRSTEIIEKQKFGCMGVPAFDRAVAALGTKQLVLCGIESHVCVQQTALDLAAADYRVHIAADAVTSRHEEDERTALSRMRDAGITITTSEAVLFELLESSEAPEFKEIAKLVK